MSLLDSSQLLALLFRSWQRLTNTGHTQSARDDRDRFKRPRVDCPDDATSRKKSMSEVYSLSDLVAAPRMLSALVNLVGQALDGLQFSCILVLAEQFDIGFIVDLVSKMFLSDMKSVWVVVVKRSSIPFPHPMHFWLDLERFQIQQNGGMRAGETICEEVRRGVADSIFPVQKLSIMKLYGIEIHDDVLILHGCLFLSGSANPVEVWMSDEEKRETFRLFPSTSCHSRRHSSLFCDSLGLKFPAHMYGRLFFLAYTRFGHMSCRTGPHLVVSGKVI